jgi:Pentapeptide repeats (9 copies)
MTDMQSNKTKPEHNPWYLLATLHGEAESPDDEVHAGNRRAWNRFMAGELTEDARDLLIEEDRCSAEELIPFSAEELADVEKGFSERHRQATGSATEATPPLPNLKRDRVDFSNLKFNCPFSTAGFFFPRAAAFSGTTFSGWADFSGATFFGPANFSGATFSDLASFSDATFSGATSDDQADFSGATFFDRAFFQGATFSGAADFSRAMFSDTVNFLGATFSSGGAAFSGTTFKKTTVFVNAEMKGPTFFENATFSSEPPEFFGAKLHEKTVWSGVKWPLPKDDDEARWFVDAYERLKLEMDRLKKHEDELDFFALELQSRRMMHGDWQPVSEPGRTITLFRPAHGLAIALYGWLSDYGRSYVRPLWGLLITVAAGVLPFWWRFGVFGFFQAVGLSFANTFGVLGFRKDLIDPQVLTCLPGWLKAIASAQTIAGIVFLFLFGLAIRNRFRMK